MLIWRKIGSDTSSFSSKAITGVFRMLFQTSFAVSLASRAPSAAVDRAVSRWVACEWDFLYEDLQLSVRPAATWTFVNQRPATSLESNASEGWAQLIHLFAQSFWIRGLFERIARVSSLINFVSLEPHDHQLKFWALQSQPTVPTGLRIVLARSRFEQHLLDHEQFATSRAPAWVPQSYE